MPQLLRQDCWRRQGKRCQLEDGPEVKRGPTNDLNRYNEVSTEVVCWRFGGEEAGGGNENEQF